ncbi:SDR family NAD(P)-dependent oxidoreductase [Microvirga brassicacearum]|uniref:SDR family NAD(P)-dependent oxidoreductase n=1 Tax=Microvirga brassicacearum TaxID=2580413 RepID=UPI00191341C1|nr:SDR family oxidoreductase [Microvirga brassicacearum]
MTRLFDLTGRTALVTGATSGIGLALAQGLAGAGAVVVVNGRNPDRIDRTVEMLRCQGLQVHGSRFDCTLADEIAPEIARIEREIGPIDILINNAGIQRRAPLLEMDPAMWDEVIRTNLTGVFLVGQAVAKGMVARRRGKIVNICSLASEVARKTIAPYVAAKGAVRQLTRAMCVEWAGSNIQANGIGPGYFATPLNTTLKEDPAFDSWVRSRTPAGRWGEPDELVGAAIFLSSAASDFVNGQIIYVDGGLLASM